MKTFSKTLLKKILPPGLFKFLQFHKIRIQNQWRTIRQGYGQPVVANDFFANYDLDDPHQYAFAFYYFAYRYRVMHGQVLPWCWLRFLVKDKDIPQLPGCKESSAASRKVLRCSSMALLAIPEHVDSNTKIGARDNIQNRKKCARKGYTVRPIEYDEHLDEIYAINTSAEERGGKPMSQSYRQYPTEYSRKLTRLGIDFRAFGCFKDETLVAYLSFARYGNFLKVDKVLGHKQHLRCGVMNLLFFRAMEILSRSHAGYYLYYKTISEHTLGQFKRRLGFRPCNMILPAPPGFVAAAKKLNPEGLTGDWEQRYLETLDLQASFNYSSE